MGSLQSLRSKAHVLEHLGARVGVLQGFSLELNGRQGSINLGELLLIPLLSFQSLQCRYGKDKRTKE